MLPANKHLLPIIGLDIHIVNVPTPAGPIPLPIPHPFIGLTLDIIDYIPFLGSTVNINSLPRGCTFTNGMLAIKKHIPLPPGGTFLLPPIIGHNTFNFYGSKTVHAQHSPLSPSGYKIMSCNDIGIPLTLSPPPGKGFWPPIPSLYAPKSVTIPIPTAKPVMVGGPYVADLAGMIRMLVMSFAFGCILKKLGQKFSEMFPNLTQKLKDLNCKIFGEPVDVVSGCVIYQITDFEMPGPLPLKWERRWYSDSGYEGFLGHGTHLCYDLTLITSFKKNSIHVVLPDGRPASFSLLLNVGDQVYNRQEKITLFKTAEGYRMRDHANELDYDFVQIAPDTFKPLKLVNLNGFTIQFNYNKSGRLLGLIDSVGRNVSIVYDDHGRMIEVNATYAGSERRFVRYEYNENNDLSRITDAMGNTTQVRFVNHLMVEKTDRNGQTFFWEYEGAGLKAKCIHTWGENGLLENWAKYGKGWTEVTNSLRETTKYYYNDVNLITQIIDPAGCAVEYLHTEHMELYREVDEEGNITGYTYDNRGNLTSKHLPDNTSVTFLYNEENQLIMNLDAQNQETVYVYNEQKLIRAIIKPDRSVLSIKYHDKGLIASIKNEQDHLTKLFYDEDCNLSSMELPNGSTNKWSYDRWGRCIETINPENKSQYAVYDDLNRIVKLKKFDSNTLKLTYDAYEKVTLAEDRHYKVKFTYNALGSVLTREENDALIRFKYDTENRLLCLRNESNEAYSFQRNAKGEVIGETGFDGVKRSYERDRAGKVVRAERPGGKFTIYEYDSAGRLTRSEHSDGTWETYSYNRNGQIIEAGNENSILYIERDNMGRIVGETCGEHWVKSNYGKNGKRIGITSSLGADIKHDYNVDGTVSISSAKIHESQEWRSEFAYNALGLETKRILPGDLQKIFEYDAAGNPLKELVVAGDRETLKKSHSWNVNRRLAQTVNELTKGVIKYGHDDFGNLAWAQNQDNEFDYRLPDATGNLYKTKELRDRKYGAGGRLLESESAFYRYDEEGSLISKKGKDGGEWKYEWKGNGLLQEITRPDGKAVQFEYDALGRRLSKIFNGKITRWLWNGNVPLHEWEYNEKEKSKPIINEFGEITSDKPEPVSNLISWIFDEGSFKPAAKIDEHSSYSIITDYLGTPVQMYNKEGRKIWQVTYDIYGKIRRNGTGSSNDCPFRYQGQYEDVETGLYYNRFRYYNPDDGIYINQDPVRLKGGRRLYSYTHNPTTWIDPFGLSECTTSYRGDRSSATPDKVFNEGFAPKGTGDDLLAHVTSNTTPGNFVSTSSSREIGEGFAGKNGYLYEISSSRGIDVNDALGAQSPFPEQLERAIPGGVLPSEVVGAYPMRGGQPTGDFIPNPNFVE